MTRFGNVLGSNGSCCTCFVLPNKYRRRAYYHN
jgi:hypothetical protein